MKQGIIYKLTSPSKKCYIGQTIQSLERRLSIHKSEKRNRPLANAIKKYGINNFKIEILELCNENIISNRECHWIAAINCKTPNGYNLSDGGERGPRGYKMTAEQKAKISKALKGKKRSKEFCEKMSKAHKGKTVSEESRIKIGQTAKKVWERPGYKDKMRKSHQGYKHSEETKQKMSKAHEGNKNRLGIKHKPETIEKMKLDRANKPHCPQTGKFLKKETV